MGNNRVALDIIVVGGGIAGLGAAITLSRAGHNVTVLEKSKFKKEAGFMIGLSPNALRVLRDFDFDFVRARAVPCREVTLRDGTTLELITHHASALHDKDKESSTFYRPDLHNELKRIALLQIPGIKTPALRLGAEVVSVDIQAGSVKLKNGDVLTADLIVGADGERSLVKAAFQDGGSLRQAPLKLLRAIIPRERLTTEADMKMLDMTANNFAIFVSGTRMITWFEGRDGLLQDIEAGYLMERGEDMKAQTDPQKTYDLITEKFGDFHPNIVDALKRAERISEWEVHHASPIPHLYKHKALLIGDAAHSMFPTTGQGGSQSMEDVGALGVLLSNLHSKSEMPERLKIMDKVRKGRAENVQALSGIVFGTEERIRTAKPNHKINELGILSVADHINFLHSYDVLEESRKALEVETRAKARL